MTKPSKKRMLKKQLFERQLILTEYNQYEKLISIGYTHDQAVSKLKKQPSSSLEKIKGHVDFAKNTFGRTGVSLKGTRMTSDVYKYIKQLEEEGEIQPYKKGQDILYLKHPKIWKP